VYDSVFAGALDITHVGCFAHARWKFVEAEKKSARESLRQEVETWKLRFRCYFFSANGLLAIRLERRAAVFSSR